MEDTGAVCSFTPSTRVLLKNGKTKPIEKIKPGDQVEAGDPLSGKRQGVRKVTARLVHRDTDLVDIKVRMGRHRTETLHTTYGHPFWDKTVGAWQAAGLLAEGHTLATADDRQVVVAGVSVRDGAQFMYNLTVADLHTYYVLAGATPVLVHNSACGPAPENAYSALSHIDQHGTAPPGFRGGRTFRNLGRNGEERLPEFDSAGNPIIYQEWDVNPYVRGVNRGAERLVTGSDGSARYTNNHYTSYVQIR
jgi:guanyl-specific ribonuclease Sa